ncbi:hypothetical protein ACE1CI_10800 [Aerosakkonemataceae cyanobacterium BLCC-F50]|uniref:Uncharacterized protein n=1 Tax=Floridaenema flaviceps BLCC-F50 TaxID=3153642 RepID=A0ABV4XNV4_9CYAN
MSIHQILLDYSLTIFDCIEDLFDEFNEFFRSLIIQVEEELELRLEIKETLTNEIKEKQNELNELQKEIIFCNSEIMTLNTDLINCEQRIANFPTKLDSQNLNSDFMNSRKIQQDSETKQALINYLLKPESMNQMRIQAQEIRNHAKNIRKQSAEIRKNINYLKKELFFTISDTSSLTQFEQT